MDLNNEFIQSKLIKSTSMCLITKTKYFSLDIQNTYDVLWKLKSGSGIRKLLSIEKRIINKIGRICTNGAKPEAF